jgi:hypothetical protein
LVTQALALTLLALLLQALPVLLPLVRNWLWLIPRVAGLRRYVAHHDYARCYLSVAGEIHDHPIVDLACAR